VKKGRSKFNVSANTRERTYAGMVFDSALEMRYYRDYIMPRIGSGEIIKCQRQVRYILQEGYTYKEHKYLPIYYDADFVITYNDGREVVVDIKGFPEPVARLKRKIFQYKYPDIDFQWVTYSVKYLNGWGLYDDFVKASKASEIKKNKKEEENLDGEE
jgi:hypothetical protein